MAITAWILVQTEVGKARRVADQLAALSVPGVRVITADTVTGPFDVIARVEGNSLDDISSAVDNTLSTAGGVQDTVTCLAINVG